MFLTFLVCFRKIDVETKQKLTAQEKISLYRSFYSPTTAFIAKAFVYTAGKYPGS